MLEKTYNPSLIEEKWQSFWLKNNLFQALPDQKNKEESFSIVIPPPNVTGSLHLGHALNNTLQDILCRYMRMQGRSVLWVPGTDHAGIATQNVVERQLAAEGKQRKDMSREQFVERVWQWKEESGGTIINQLKRLGCSCDWSRERFTMDEGLSKAVREVFVKLYQEGLIYRGNYMINWCPRCESALADLEVEYPDEFENSHLYRLRYPLAQAIDGVDGIVVDTTRPETMLGDTAVAVHPDDPRYQKLIGAEVILPIVGRRIPIIADSFVDPEFGSGAVKITPAHDPNDFEAGRRHGLLEISVIGQDGKMTIDAGIYAGQDRFECRKKIVEELKVSAVLQEIKPHLQKTGRCYRCSTITESLISKQWFVKMRGLADEASKAVRESKTEIVPQAWAKTYFQWLDNIRDWCISRQLWWGHQIPVWYCEDCSSENVSLDLPKSCAKCGSAKLKQDPDVLDTWFSSALWPFSTMGWPEKTEELKAFYPTSVLITGFDILFFWVARMMMMGLKIMGEVPFNYVYLHAMVRDEHGQKMSKTKGNVIDPLDLIKDYGADALRFSLAIMCVEGRDINLSVPRIEGYRNFVNKIWNAVRYVLMTISDGEEKVVNIEMRTSQDLSQDVYSRWIRSRLSEASKRIDFAYGEYQFSEICDVSYHFFWDEFCSWYLEISKLQLRSDQISVVEKQKIKANLLFLVDASLRILSPVIPFVTEELWHELPSINGELRESLTKTFCNNKLSAELLKSDSKADEEVELIRQVVTEIRNVRSEKNIPPAKKLAVRIENPSSNADKRVLEFVLGNKAIVCGLARLEDLIEGESSQYSVRAFACGLVLHVELSGAIDLEAEVIKYQQEILSLEAELDRVVKKLSNQSFVDKAPQEVVEKEKAKQKEFEDKLTARREAISALTAG